MLVRRLTITLVGSFCVHILDLTMELNKHMCNCKNYLGLFFYFFREMWFVDCSCMHLQGHCARRYGGAELWKLTSFFHAVVVNGVAQISPVLYDLGC